MSFFRDWLLGVTAAAMLIALADAMLPPGSVKKVGRLTGGLLLLVAILQPVTGLDYAGLSRSLSRAREDLKDYAAQPQTENFGLMKSIIEARSGAYIEDKAMQMDIVCRAQVTCVADLDTEYPYPAQVTVTGELTEAQQGKLTRFIEADLAIPAKNQTYQREGGETP